MAYFQGDTARFAMRHLADVRAGPTQQDVFKTQGGVLAVVLAKGLRRWETLWGA
jgi:hypothetical protein